MGKKWGSLLDTLQRTVCCASSLPHPGTKKPHQSSESNKPLIPAPRPPSSITDSFDNVFDSVNESEVDYAPPRDSKLDENYRRFERSVHIRKMSQKMSQSGGFRGPKKSTSEYNLPQIPDDYVPLRFVTEPNSAIQQGKLKNNQFVSMPTIAPKVPDRRQKPHIIVNNRQLPPARPPMTEKPAVPSSATSSPRTPTHPQQQQQQEPHGVYLDVVGKSKSPVQKVETPDTMYTKVDSNKTKEISDL